MNSVVSHAEMRELLGAYALHAMSDDESLMVEAHIETCAACRNEVSEYLDVAASLASVDEMPVNPATWDRILGEVRAMAPRGTLPSAEPNPSDRRVADVVDLADARDRKRRLGGWRGALVAAVAATAVAVPLTTALTGTSTPSLAALARAAAAAPGSSTATLRDSAGRSLAEAVVTVSGQGYLLRDSLPPLELGRTYQLWALTGAAPVSAGVLGRDPKLAAFTLAAPTSALAISVEPAGGSVSSVVEPVASGDVRRA